jgi:hypothetical protein
MRGGLRSRLIADSARVAILAGLGSLGWFDGTVYDSPPGPRRHRPLRYVPRPVEWDDSLYVNAIAISTDDVYDNPLGLGGEVEDTAEMWVDVFAESDQLGWQLAMDARDIALGKFPELGRDGPVIDVYDLRQATPSPFTQVDVTAATVDRAGGEAQEWQAHWFMVRIDLEDDYSDEAGSVHTVTDWTDDYAGAWQRIQAIELSV